MAAERAVLSFYLLYWYKSTNTDAEGTRAWQQSALYSIYLLYSYKSANTDAEGGAWQNIEFNFKFLVDASMAAGTQFSCFTSTTVQIVTLKALQSSLRRRSL